MRIKFLIFRNTMQASCLFLYSNVTVKSSMCSKVYFFYRRIPRISFADSSPFPFAYARRRRPFVVKKSVAQRDISSRLDLHVASHDFHVRARTMPGSSEFLGYIIRSFCGAAPHRHVCIVRARTPPMSYKPAGQSCGRYQLAVLSALYTGRPSGVATRDLTQIEETAPPLQQHTDCERTSRPRHRSD